MNRLNKILLSFVLPIFCLLINVSYAEFDLGTQYTCTMIDVVNVSTTQVIPGYSTATIYRIGYQYLANGSSTYESTYKQLLQDIVNAGYDYVTLSSGNIFILKNADFGLNSNNYFYVINKNEGDYTIYRPANENGYAYYYTGTTPYYRNLSSITIVDSTISVKKLLDFGRGVTRWDGEYYYEVPTTPDTPSLPSNAEIAQAVQSFYNSDYYKNNKDFSDFMVLYNYDTKYFDFIGHNFGIDLGQVIVPPNYEYEGYSYNQDWWKFFLRNITSEIASNLWNRYYWLYSTNDFGEKITYEGKGSIKDLINLHFSTKSTIVYSTTDYPVVKIETNEETGVLEPVEGTIPGDQYTYDENLDPSTNEYNPLENFVPSNPAQSILGDVDFDEINKTFEENKDILNIENASWLFSANNQLTNYFIGFLSLLIVFLIISRILGG